MDRTRRTLAAEAMNIGRGVRPDQDTEPRRPFQPGLGRRAARRGRNGAADGHGWRSARRDQRRPVQRRLEPSSCWASSTFRSATTKRLGVRSRRRSGYVDDLGAHELAVIPCIPDLIEADVVLGRMADAGRLVERLDAHQDANGGRWAAAMAAARDGRCWPPPAANSRPRKQGDRPVDRGPGVDGTAIRGSSVPPRARVRSTAGRRRSASPASSSRRAREAFARLGGGALGQARRCRAGAHRRPPVDPVRPDRHRDPDRDRSSPQGRTNQETADALFLSPNTVQTSLKRVYQKLGVRSRTELAARVGRGPDVP